MMKYLVRLDDACPTMDTHKWMKIEDILDILEDKCQLPADLRSRIEDEKNLQTLTRWLKLAAKADSLEEFLSQM